MFIELLNIDPKEDSPDKLERVRKEGIPHKYLIFAEELMMLKGKVNEIINKMNNMNCPTAEQIAEQLAALGAVVNQSQEFYDVEDVNLYTNKNSYYANVFNSFDGKTSASIPTGAIYADGKVKSIYFYNDTGKYVHLTATSRSSYGRTVDKPDVFDVKIAPGGEAVVNYPELRTFTSYDGTPRIGYKIRFYNDANYSQPSPYKSNMGIVEVAVIKMIKRLPTQGGTDGNNSSGANSGSGNGSNGIGLGTILSWANAILFPLTDVGGNNYEYLKMAEHEGKAFVEMKFRAPISTGSVFARAESFLGETTGSEFGTIAADRMTVLFEFDQLQFLPGQIHKVFVSSYLGTTRFSRR